MRAKSQIDKKGADLDRDGDGAATSAPTCAAAPATSRSSTPSRPSPRARRSSRALGAGGRRVAAPSTRPAELALGDRGYVDDIRVPGMLHAALHLTDHARADVVAIDTTAAARGRRRRRRVHRRRHPRRAARRHHLQGLAGDDPGRRAHVATPATCSRSSSPRPAQQARAAAPLVDVAYDVLPPVTDPLAAIEPGRRARRVGHRRQRAVAQRLRPRRRRRRARRQRPHACTRCSRPSASSTRSSSRSPRSPCRRAPATTGRCTSTRAARACGTTATTSAACSASPTDRVTVELVSNGGAFGGKEDMSNQAHAVARRVAARPPGEVHAVARGELPDARQAAPDPPRVLGRLRRRRRCSPRSGCAPIGDSGAYASVGMKVLERAAGHATGPYHVPAVDVRGRSRRAPTTSCAARSAASAPTRRSSRWTACSTASPTPSASAAGRSASATSSAPARCGGPGQIMDDGCRRRRGVPRRDQAGLRRGDRRRQGRRARARAEELRPRQRLPRGVGRRRALPRRRRPGRGPPRLDRDGPGRAHRRPAGRRPGARHRPGAHRRHRRHDPPARLRPDHRVTRHADGGRRGAAGVRTPRWPPAARPTSTTTASTSSTGRRSSATRPTRTRRSTPRSATPPSSPSSTATPARSSASSPSTTSARRSTRSCAPARSRAACTWASATR